MSILSALKMQSNSIDDLAKLPQAMIMQMAQKKQIDKEMLAPILARKAEMMEAVSRSKALQQPAEQPSVMEQVMAKNIQAENPANAVPQMPQQTPQMPQQMPQMPPQMPQQMPEAGVAQLPIPERQYAGGGIVAFARGDLVDLDAEDDDNDILAEYAEAMAAGERAMMMDQQTSGQMPQALSRIPADNAGVGIRYKDPIPAGASKGVKSDENGLAQLRSIVLQKESGGRRFDKDGKLLTSSKGAEGEMQVMPATARDPGFGIKPIQNNSPDELRRVGDEYLGVLFNKYQDPKLAMIAYNMGPGATDKWIAAGADPKKLPKETQGYIRGVNLAEGGKVQRFVKGDLVMGDFGEVRRAALPPGSTVVDDFGNIVEKDGKKIKPKILPGAYSKFLQRVPGIGTALTAATLAEPALDALMATDTGTASEDLDPIAAMQGTQGGYERPERKKDVYTELKESPRIEDVRPASVKPANVQPTNVPKFDFPPQGGIGPTDAELGRNALTQEPTEKKSRLDAFIDRINAGNEDLAAQRKQDKNMALLAAGLGMLGGTSQYAFENVGKGGLAGVQYLSEANKQRAAEKAALDKAQVTAIRYQDLADIAKGSKQDTLAYRQAVFEEGMEKNALANIAEINRNIELQAEKNVKSMKGFNEAIDPAKLLQLQQTEIARLRAENQPLLDRLYRKARMEMPVLSSTSEIQSQADKIIAPKNK